MIPIAPVWFISELSIPTLEWPGLLIAESVISIPLHFGGKPSRVFHRKIHAAENTEPRRYSARSQTFTYGNHPFVIGPVLDCLFGGMF